MTENKERELFIDPNTVPSGHLFLWVDKFHLCQSVLDWFKGTSS